MEPERKLRASPPLNFPGGGGVNVSRVIKVLGGMSIAVFTAGWATGQLLRDLIDQHGLLTRVVPIHSRTRVSATAFETSTGQEYRITPPGPEMTEAEWRACLDAVFEFEAEYIVATGSLPRGVPEDFYARVAHGAKKRGSRVILDCDGEPFHQALGEGVYMVKPNLRELSELTGTAGAGGSDAELHAMTQKLIGIGRTEVVVVSLGGDGAFLDTGAGTVRLRTPKVAVKSAVGAGDSFVGGMTVGLARGMPIESAFAVGVAAGTATVLTAGSELCRRADVERLYHDLTGSVLAL
jgi:6-phosphofructokinase 2